MFESFENPKRFAYETLRTLSHFLNYRLLHLICFGFKTLIHVQIKPVWPVSYWHNFPGWVLPYIMWRDVPPLRVYFSLISSPSVGILLRPFKEKSLSGCLFCEIWRRNPPDGILFTRFWGKSPSVGIKFCPECSSRYFVSLLFLSFEPQIPLRVSKLSHFSPSKLAH